MKYDAVRRPPIGKPRAIERGLTLERANTMLKAGQCDQIEPAGFRDSLDTYAGRFVLLNGKRPVQSDWPNRVLTDREVEVHSAPEGISESRPAPASPSSTSMTLRRKRR